MRSRLAAAVLLVACAGCERKPVEDQAVLAQHSTEVRRVIEAQNANAVRWYATGQIDSVAGLFAIDARQMGPNAAPLVGREAIRRYWADAVGRGTWTFTLSTQDVSACGTCAVERGAYTLAFTPGPNAPAGAAAFVDRGNYLVEWRKENGAWLIVNDLATSEMPLPVPPLTATQK